MRYFNSCISNCCYTIILKVTHKTLVFGRLFYVIKRKTAFLSRALTVCIVLIGVVKLYPKRKNDFYWKLYSIFQNCCYWENNNNLKIIYTIACIENGPPQIFFLQKHNSDEKKYTDEITFVYIMFHHEYVFINIVSCLWSIATGNEIYFTISGNCHKCSHSFDSSNYSLCINFRVCNLISFILN